MSQISVSRFPEFSFFAIGSNTIFLHNSLRFFYVPSELVCHSSLPIVWIKDVKYLNSCLRNGICYSLFLLVVQSRTRNLIYSTHQRYIYFWICFYEFFEKISLPFPVYFYFFFFVFSSSKFKAQMSFRRSSLSLRSLCTSRISTCSPVSA